MTLWDTMQGIGIALIMLSVLTTTAYMLMNHVSK